MNLYQKLLEIQKEVDSFTKDKKGFNYNYTTGNQVLSKIRPKMNELGLLLKQEVISVENERIDYVTGTGEKQKDKSEILSSVAQKFTWIDCESGETEECLWHGNGMNDWDKGLGSALTYAERYFLLKFFHVPTDEDDNDARQDNSGAVKNGRQTTNDDKPWLNKTVSKTDDTLSEDWKNVTAAIRQGKAEVRDVYKKFKVNKTLRAELDAISKNGVPA